MVVFPADLNIERAYCFALCCEMCTVLFKQVEDHSKLNVEISTRNVTSMATILCVYGVPMIAS